MALMAKSFLQRMFGKSMPKTGASPVPPFNAPPSGLPVAQLAPPLPTAQQIGDVAPLDQADEANAPFANRYTSPDLGVPIGQWVRIRSTFVYAARYDPYSPTSAVGDLRIETTDGWIGRFENVTIQPWADLFHAPRKGVWLTNWPNKSNYVTERAQQYFGAALTARVHDNA